MTTLYMGTLKGSEIVNILVPYNIRRSVSYTRRLIRRLRVGCCAVGVGSAISTLVGMVPSRVRVSRRAGVGLPPEVHVTALCTIDRSGGNEITGAYGLSRSCIKCTAECNSKTKSFDPLSELAMARIGGLNRALKLPRGLVRGAPVSKLYKGASRRGLNFACRILSGCVHANVYKSLVLGGGVSAVRHDGYFGLRPVPYFRPRV